LIENFTMVADRWRGNLQGSCQVGSGVVAWILTVQGPCRGEGGRGGMDFVGGGQVGGGGLPHVGVCVKCLACPTTPKALCQQPASGLTFRRKCAWRHRLLTNSQKCGKQSGQPVPTTPNHTCQIFTAREIRSVGTGLAWLQPHPPA
jgi:hypothetical protein